MTMKTEKSIRKVLLIFPPSSSVGHFEPMVTTPMGLAYLGAALRQRDYEVVGLDALAEAPYQSERLSENVVRYGLTADQIMTHVEVVQPDVVGLSCLFSNQWPPIREIAARIKDLDQDIIVATGGTHPTFAPERCLRDSKIDFIVLGEGERIFPDVLDRLRLGRSLNDQDGVAWRDNNVIKVNPPGNLIDDLNELPFPAHDLFPPERYFDIALPMGYHMRSRRSLPMVTSRGCPFNCTFCSSTRFWRNRYRARSAENVMAEIEWLVSCFGIEEIKFQDDNLTAQRKRARHLFEMMSELDPILSWNTPNGIAIDTLDDEMLGLMRRSGCFEITLSAESGDQDILNKLIHKPLKLDRIREVNEAARRHGIYRVAYFIIGFPGESMEQIRNTIKFGRELAVDWCIYFIYNPLPGSPMYDDCLARGYISEDDFFKTGNVYFSSIMDSEEWTSKELETIVRREYLRNYLSVLRNPRTVLPSYLALMQARPSVYRYTASRAKKAAELLSPANWITNKSRKNQ